MKSKPWLPYVAPFVIYMAFLLVQSPNNLLWVYPVKTIAVAAALAYFWPRYEEIRLPRVVGRVPPRGASPELRSREVSVDFLAVQASNKRDRTALEDKTDAVVLAGGFEAFEIGNLLKSLGRLDLLDDFPDSAKQRGVVDASQVCVEGFAEGGLHAQRASR